MGIPASPFGCTDLNITVSGYRLPTISHLSPQKSSPRFSKALLRYHRINIT